MAAKSLWNNAVERLRTAGLHWTGYTLNPETGIASAKVEMHNMQFTLRVGALQPYYILPVFPSFVFAYELTFARCGLDRVISQAYWRMAGYMSPDGQESFFLEYVLLRDKEGLANAVLSIELTSQMYDPTGAKAYMDYVQKFLNVVAV